jgi:hypothetical protein
LKTSAIKIIYLGICNRYVYYSASRAEDSLMAALWSHYSGLVAVRGRSGSACDTTVLQYCCVTGRTS